MDNYSFLRQLADSWGLLAMFAFFIGVILWVFRPGASPEHKDIANMVFRNDTTPANGETAPKLKEASQ